MRDLNLPLPVTSSADNSKRGHRKQGKFKIHILRIFVSLQLEDYTIKY